MQEHPQRRDRIVVYHAEWNTPNNPSIPQLRSLSLEHNCIKNTVAVLEDGEASLLIVGGAFTKDSAEHIIQEFQRLLAMYGIEAVFSHCYAHMIQTIYRLRSIGGEGIKRASSLDVLSLINNVASIFNQPPVEHANLRKHIMSCDVFVTLLDGKQAWISETQWLADTAHTRSIYDNLYVAFGRMAIQGDAIALTLKSTSDVRGAASIYDMLGITFTASKVDQMRLHAACQQGMVPKAFEITINFSQAIVVSPQLVSFLASYIDKVAFLPAGK